MFCGIPPLCPAPSLFPSLLNVFILLCHVCCATFTRPPTPQRTQGPGGEEAPGQTEAEAQQRQLGEAPGEEEGGEGNINSKGPPAQVKYVLLL